MALLASGNDITLEELQAYLFIPSWDTRTLPFITFISPGLNAFFAEWIGDENTTEKKVAIYDYPERDDTATLDLGRSGTKYPLRIFFHGPGADIDAKDFRSALDEKGKWEIIHPTNGFIRAQPLSFTVIDNPTESGGVYEIKTEFIEAIDVEELTLGTGFNLLGSIFDAIAAVSEIAALVVAVALAVQNAFSNIQALRASYSKSKVSAQERLSKLAAESADAVAQFNSLIREIETELDNTVLDIAAIGSAMQQLIALPAQISTDFATRFQTYKDMTNDIFGLAPETSTIDDRNAVSAQELTLSSIIIANSIIATSSIFRTRTEALNAADQIRDQFNAIANHLDLVQSNFGDEYISEQYFSNSSSYSELAGMTSKAIQYIRNNAFDLSVEKRVIIQAPISTMKFVIQEYGPSSSELDAAFNDFVDANKLFAEEILLLPAGREVIAYGR